MPAPQGTHELDTRAMQVAEKVSSLNSADCFVLLTPSTMYVWRGGAANASELATAEGIADVLRGERVVTVLAEGDEPREFWEALGGKGDYPRSSKPPAEASREPILFQCSTSRSGSFGVDEPIYDYSQASSLTEPRPTLTSSEGQP